MDLPDWRKSILQGLYPLGRKQRERALQDKKDEVAELSLITDPVQRLKKAEFHWIDSKLDSDRSDVDIDGKSFFATFQKIIPPGLTLKEYVEDSLRHKNGRAIGIEFGGIGSRLFSGFSSGFFARSLGVTLFDHRRRRSYDVHDDPSQVRDDRIHHSVLQQDLLEEQWKGKVDEWLQGQKADFIIERLGGGFDYFPKDPYFFIDVLQEWWNRLNEGGLLLVQVPSSIALTFGGWAKMMQEKYGIAMDFEYAVGGNNIHTPSVLRMRKLAGAPAKLPVFSAREMRQATRKSLNWTPLDTKTV